MAGKIYKVLNNKSAEDEKELKKIQIEEVKAIRDKIRKLAHDPHPQGVEKLSGEDNLYRVRCGDYRIIFTIQDKVLMIIVFNIGHRREIYRKK